MVNLQFPLNTSHSKDSKIGMLQRSSVVEPVKSSSASRPGRGKLSPCAEELNLCSLHPITKSLIHLQLLQLQNPARRNRRTSLGPSRSITITNLKWVHISILLYLSPLHSLRNSLLWLAVPADASKMAARGAPLFPRLLRWDAGVLSSERSWKKRRRSAGSCVCACFFPPLLFSQLSLIWSDVKSQIGP